jgi:hypothetical protein
VELEGFELVCLGRDEGVDRGETVGDAALLVFPRSKEWHTPEIFVVEP